MCRPIAIYFIVFSVFAILCVNFSMRFLTKFWIVFLLSVALGISLLFYGIKKENSPLRSDIRIKVLIWIAVSLMIQYSIGISVGFLKIVTPWTDAIYVVVLAIISEILRYILCFKSSSIRQIILIGIMFALVDVVFPIAYADAKNLDDLVEFSTIYILPSISIPTRGTASGKIKATTAVTIIGNNIFSVLDTGLNCSITIERSFSVVSAFIIGG